MHSAFATYHFQKLLEISLKFLNGFGLAESFKNTHLFLRVKWQE